MGRSIRPTGWRKIASATWGHPRDPQIYGDLDVDAQGLLDFIAAARELTGVRVTVTHLAGKALAHALAENRDLNVRLRGSRYIEREQVDIFFIVSTDEGNDLSGVKVENADRKPVVEIARELSERAARIRAGDDELGKAKARFGALPNWALKVAMAVGARLAVDLNLDLPQLGLPRQPFGCAMVSSVGMFGIQHAYAPLSPYYRVPLLVLVGEISQRPVVVDDQVVARPMLALSATIDHRYLDGFHAARLARSTRAYLEDPKRFEPPL